MNEPLKILFLEDSTSDAELLKAFLLSQKPNCIFKLVMTEEDFTDALDEFEPHVIISDNTLPQFSATEALLIFKQRSLNIPFILVTGTVSEEFAAGIIKAGADDYILKDRLTRLPSAIDAALQKKKTEAERKKAEDLVRFKADLLNAVGQAVIATDMKGTVQYWNNAAEKLYGWSAEEAMGNNIMALTPAQQSIEQAAAIMQELLKGNSWSGEFMVQRKDGTNFPAFVTDSPFMNLDGNITGIIGVSFDLTAQKQAEENMMTMEKKIARQQLNEQKKISRAIIRGQEEEKNHIGKELHDNINQILAGAKMFLVMAGKKNEEVKELLRYPVELLDNSIEEIRTLTYKQVTPLKNINLAEQLQKLVDSVAQTAVQQVQLHFTVDDTKLSDDLKLNIYRIIQEQVNNVLKHADSKNIVISAVTTETSIEFSVADDGKGFDTSAKRKGIGISNITNRAASYDGKLDITSNPGAGTILSVTIPY